MDKTRYWIIVASKDHAEKGLQLGIAQACHGKEAPLKRMKINDRVIIYSPKEKLDSDSKYQKFTAIGQVKDELVYQCEMSHDFKPFRRNINYNPCTELDIVPLIPQLQFIENKKQWGYPFRYGFFEINAQDFELLSGLMMSNVDSWR